MIRRRLSEKLFCLLGPTILITIGLVSMLAFFSARYEINHAYDAQMINNANVLWMLVQEELGEEDGFFQNKEYTNSYTDAQLDLNEDVDDYAKGRMFRIWKGKRIVRSSDTAFPASVARASAGFSGLVYKGHKWRVFALPVPNTDILIEVGERDKLRRNFLDRILADITFPLLFLVPVIGLLLWAGIRVGLAPIRSLIDQVQKRSPDDLSPMVMDDLPRDLLPLGKSINILLEKLARSLGAERLFAEQAAHQLRTPLAGLKLQLQLLSADVGKVEVIDKLLKSVDRAIDLVSKLLTAARVSHEPINLKPVLVYKVSAACIAGLGGLIEKKNLEVTLDGDEILTAQTDETLFSILFSNIFENAVKYSPIGGKIRVVVGKHDYGLAITVEDSGPGIPEDKRHLVFRKFSRVDNHKEEGSGLGLAIAADIIDRLQGRIFLEAPDKGQGLIVRIFLP